MKKVALATALLLLAVPFVLSAPSKVSEPLLLKALSTPEKYADQIERFTPSDLKEMLHGVGFRGKGLETAIKVVHKESTNRPLSHNKNAKTGDNSYGLFQINMMGEMGADRRKWIGITDNKELFNPVLNAQVAYRMSNKGTDWSAWRM